MKTLLTLAFALSLGVLALSFQLPGRTATLGNDQGCFRALYTRNHPNASVAMIGSSRIRRGFDPDRMAKLIGLSEMGVVNLGHPGTQPLFDFEVVQEMLVKERMSPDIILAGVVPVSWRQLELERAAVGKLPFERVALSNGRVTVDGVAGAGFGTLAGLASQQEQNGLMRIWNAVTLQARRLDSHVKLALGGRSTWSTYFVAAAVDKDRPNICFRKGWERDKRLAGRRQYKNNYKTAFDGRLPEGDLDPHDFLTNPNYLAEREGLKRIAQLAQDRGIKAYAIYVPGVYTAQLPESFLESFEAEIGMALLTFPPYLRRTLGAKHYVDPTHLSPQGRQMASNWLAARLQADLGPQ